MAITKTIEIDVNSQSANSNINQLTNSIDQNTESVKTLKQQYKEAVLEVQKLADEFGATSQQVTEAAKRAADLKDRIEDANDTIAAFKGEGAFNATAKALGSVASGFSAVEGAMVLAGGQSEEFEQAMLRLQGAMALAQGLEGLEDVGRSFKQLGAVAKNALAGIRSGIAATGIGVLLLALGAVVAYWDDIKSLVGGVSSEQEKLNELAAQELTAQQSKLDAIGGQENILKLQGKSERDILNMKIAQTDQVIKATENQIKQNDITAKAQIAAAQRNKDILTGIIKFIQAPLSILLSSIDAVGEALGQNFGLAKGFESLVDKGVSLIFDPEGERKKAEETRKENLKALEKLKNDRAGYQLSIQNIDKQASDNAKNKAKERAQKNKEDAEKYAKEKADALERIRQGEIDTEEERRAEEKRQIQKQYEELIAEAEKYGQDTLALKEAQRTKEKELEEKFKAEDEEKEKEKLEKEQSKKIEELELKKEFDSLNFEQQRAVLTERENVLLQDKILSEEQRTKLEEEYSNARKTIDEKEKEAKRKNIEAVSNLLGNLAGVLGESTAAGKAAAVAQATISTYQSAVQSYNSLSGIPIVGPALGAVAAGVAVASGIANVKKIVSVKTPKGGGGGASVPSGGGAVTPPKPQFNVVGNTGVNQIAQTLGNQQPVQAYVVANQVTTQQALDRNIVNNASLG